jgi:hypothetical protein
LDDFGWRKMLLCCPGTQRSEPQGFFSFETAFMTCSISP